jgi:FixJ family two-component response regulator
MNHLPGTRAPALVHIVDADREAQQLLTDRLTAAGIESRAYAHLSALLLAPPADVPGCLVIDAQPPVLSGLEAEAIRLLRTIRCPIVVTAHPADVAMATLAVKTGALDFVNKPLCEQEIVASVRKAIEVDRQQRLITSRHAALRARFATLGRRERQVMVLVTRGLLNKQVGSDLGLSVVTVKAHRGAVMRKMGARSLPDLVRMADLVADDYDLETASQHQHEAPHPRIAVEAVVRARLAIE